MSAKQIAFDQEAREAMKRGIGKFAKLGSISRDDLIAAAQMGYRFMKLPVKLVETVEGQFRPQHVGEGANDGPVLARLTWRKQGSPNGLGTALGVDVGAEFFRIGGAR